MARKRKKSSRKGSRITEAKAPDGVAGSDKENGIAMHENERDQKRGGKRKGKRKSKRTMRR